MEHFIAFARNNSGPLPSIEEMETLIVSVQSNRDFGYTAGMTDVMSVVPNVSKAVAFRALKAARAVASHVSSGKEIPEEQATFLKEILEGKGK